MMPDWEEESISVKMSPILPLFSIQIRALSPVDPISIGAGTCTDKEAKRYDLNYFRFYTGTLSSSPGAAILVPSAGIGYPLVIEYDNRLQTAPPPGFSMTE